MLSWQSLMRQYQEGQELWGNRARRMWLLSLLHCHQSFTATTLEMSALNCGYSTGENSGEHLTLKLKALILSPERVFQGNQYKWFSLNAFDVAYNIHENIANSYRYDASAALAPAFMQLIKKRVRAETCCAVCWWHKTPSFTHRHTHTLALTVTHR